MVHLMQPTDTAVGSMNVRPSEVILADVNIHCENNQFSFMCRFNITLYVTGI